MKDFLLRNKVFLGVVLGTILLLAGGIYLFTRGGSSSTNTPTVSDALLIPKGAYTYTSASTPLMLVEFGDYECPACGEYHPLVKQLLQDFSGKLNFVFRNFPLSQHANAPVASYAAEAAGLQGKFWQMHDKLYESQNEWSSAADAKAIFIGYAKDLGLNVAKFTSDIDSQAVKAKVQSDVNDGNTIGINQTPTFYLNGKKLPLAASYEEFKQTVQDALNGVSTTSSTQPAYHIHFDLKVYVNGFPVDFTLAKYQESKTNPLDENIHFHDGNGSIVHVHSTNIALSELFTSIKYNFPKDSSVDNLKVFVNGAINSQGLNYVPQDTDRILVSFGPVNDTNIQKQIDSVTNTSCIYSLKCPERGTPPPEDCVGGLGTGCSD